ncbi:hydrolase, partial [Streptomyces zinciresistens K42]
TGRVALKAARRATRRRNLTAAVATVSALVVLPLLVWSAVGSDDGGARAADGPPARTPGPDTGSASGDPSWAGAAEAAKGDLRGKLYNLGSGLCVGVVGGDAAPNAETELTTCSAAPGQQWAYETGGLIRSGTDPELCLDSGLGYSVRLAPCTGAAAGSIRYDFTAKGALVPRADRGLGLSPAATDGSGALVLKSRDDQGDAQRWVVDTSRSALRTETVRWGAESAPEPASAPTPPGGPTATPSRTARPAATSPPPA